MTVIGLMALSAIIPEDSGVLFAEAIGAITRELVFFTVWSLYLRWSKRVAATYED